MFRSLVIILFSCLLLGSCVPSPYYQRQEAVPQNAWAYDFKPDFKFDITDTTALYNLYFLINHTEAYPYSNIWLMVYTKEPGDTAFKRSRIEIPLAESNGKWMGRGMGELWQQQMRISPADHPFIFKKGTYEIRIEQNMRVNPLPEVLHVGLRVEKAGNRSSSSQMK
jgi:gliding motility-associated lipoprotein GldH